MRYLLTAVFVLIPPIFSYIYSLPLPVAVLFGMCGGAAAGFWWAATE